MHRQAPIVAFLVGGLLSLISLAGGAEVPDKRTRSPLADVAALARPVTYSETKIPLGELIQRVAADTGVKLTTSAEVVDEPVAVVVKEMPARELLEQLAEMLDYLWSQRGKPGEERFEIWQDVAAKQREEALRNASLAAREQAFRDAVAAYAELSRLSEAEITRLNADWKRRADDVRRLPLEEQPAAWQSPEMKRAAHLRSAALMLTTPASRALAGFLDQLTPRQWEQLRADEQLVLSSSPQFTELPLPAAMLRRLKATSYAPPIAIRGDPNSPGNDDRIRAEDEASGQEWKNAAGYQVTLNLALEQFVGTGRLVGSVRALPLRADGQFAPLDPEHAPWIFLLSDRTPEADLADDWERDRPRRERERATDPVFGSRQAFKPRAPVRGDDDGPGSGRGWQDRELLPEVARIYNVSIISDAYGEGNAIGVDALVSSAPLSLDALLERLFGDTHRWDRRERLIRLRDRQWPFARAREIPLRLVRHWRSLVEHDGALPLDEYLRMSRELRVAQLAGLRTLSQQPRFGPIQHEIGTFCDQWRLFQLYAALLPGQWQELSRMGKLPVRSLTAAQRPLLAAVARHINLHRSRPRDPRQVMESSLMLSSNPVVRVVTGQERGVEVGEETAPTPPAGSPPVAPARHAPGGRRFSVRNLELGFGGDAWIPFTVAAPPATAPTPALNKAGGGEAR